MSKSVLTVPSLANRLGKEEIARLGELVQDDSNCEKYFGSSKRARSLAAKKAAPFRISQALDNTAKWKEDLWTTTSGEYGALRPSGKFEHAYHLSTAKWFVADHPHWNKPVIADYKNLRSTYADLGQDFTSEFLEHNVTQEYLHQN
jgi:hypothetical protein